MQRLPVRLDAAVGAPAEGQVPPADAGADPRALLSRDHGAEPEAQGRGLPPPAGLDDRLELEPDGDVAAVGALVLDDVREETLPRASRAAQGRELVTRGDEHGGDVLAVHRHGAGAAAGAQPGAVGVADLHEGLVRMGVRALDLGVQDPALGVRRQPADLARPGVADAAGERLRADREQDLVLTRQVGPGAERREGGTSGHVPSVGWPADIDRCRVHTPPRRRGRRVRRVRRVS
nr:hypothetical protein DA06_02750 [Georgenia sp. SUBG003]